MFKATFHDPDNKLTPEARELIMRKLSEQLAIDGHLVAGEYEYDLPGDALRTKKTAMKPMLQGCMDAQALRGQDGNNAIESGV